MAENPRGGNSRGGNAARLKIEAEFPEAEIPRGGTSAIHGNHISFIFILVETLKYYCRHLTANDRESKFVRFGKCKLV